MRLASALIAAALLAPTAAFAQEIHHFVDVQAAELLFPDGNFGGNTNTNRLSITAKEEGQQEHETWTFRVNSSTSNDDAGISSKLTTCQRLAILVMSKPGKFRLDITALDRSDRDHPATMVRCGLVRL
jgi:hypothetical protein